MKKKPDLSPPVDGRFEQLFRRPLPAVGPSHLDVIDEALCSLDVADEFTPVPAEPGPVEEAHLLVQAILHRHVAGEALLARVVPVERTLVIWLDIIDEALTWLHPADYTDRVESTHMLIQEILQGHAGTAELMQPATVEI